MNFQPTTHKCQSSSDILLLVCVGNVSIWMFVCWFAARRQRHLLKRKRTELISAEEWRLYLVWKPTLSPTRYNGAHTTPSCTADTCMRKIFTIVALPPIEHTKGSADAATWAQETEAHPGVWGEKTDCIERWQPWCRDLEKKTNGTDWSRKTVSRRVIVVGTVISYI